MINKVEIQKNYTFQHNDLYGLNNILVTDNNEIYILDFESHSFTKKWIYNDILEIALCNKTLSIDYSLLMYYVNKKEELKTKSFNNHMHLVLLKRSLQALYFSKNRLAIKNKNNWMALYQLLIDN